ncbi:hypothetical protein, partial [Pseudoalteromonas luteoviolacea]
SAFSGDHVIQVCSVQTHSNNLALIQPCGNWSSKNNCTWNGWIAWSLDSEGGKLLHETAQKALTFGNIHAPRVIVRTDGNSCFGGYDKIHMMRITKNR